MSLDMSRDMKKERITELNHNIWGHTNIWGGIQTYVHTSHTIINIQGTIFKEFVPLWERTLDELA